MVLYTAASYNQVHFTETRSEHQHTRRKLSLQVVKKESEGEIINIAVYFVVFALFAFSW
jgi:hypothetical protein